MTTLENIITGNETEIRRNAIKFAQSMSYDVTEMLQQAQYAFLASMSQIHENGKTGNYELAKRYRIVQETLSTWV